MSRGATWSSYLHTLSWASWPRNYVAGLFDTPNTEPPVPALVPAPDWLRVRIWIDGELALIRSGTLLAHRRRLDMRRGLLLTEWRQRQPSGRVLRVRTLRFVSQADRALGVQILDLNSTDCLPRYAGSLVRGVRLGMSSKSRRRSSRLAHGAAAKTVAMAVSADCGSTTPSCRAQRPGRAGPAMVLEVGARPTRDAARMVAFARGEAEDDSPRHARRPRWHRARQAGRQRPL